MPTNPDLKVSVSVAPDKAAAQLRAWYQQAAGIQQAGERDRLRLATFAAREESRLQQGVLREQNRTDEARLVSAARVAKEEQRLARETEKVITESLKRQILAQREVDRQEDRSRRAAAQQAYQSQRRDTVSDVARGVVYGNLTTQGVREMQQAMSGAIKTAVEYEASLRNVNSLAKLSETAFQGLYSSVLDIAKDPDIRQGPNDLAKALYDVVSSGYQGREALDIVKVAAKGASAGLTSTTVSVSALTSVLQSGIGGFHGAKEAMDILFRSVDVGKYNFEQLASQIGDVLPIAKIAGVTFQEVNAALAAMTLRGISLSESVTALTQLLNHIVKPSKQAQKVFNELGIETGLTGIQSKGLTGILAEMSRKTEGQKQKLVELMPEVRGLKAALSLTDETGAQYTDMLAKMGDASKGLGRTQEALLEQNKSVKAQWELLRKDMEVLAVEVGPALLTALRDILKAGRPLIEIVRDLAEQFSKLDPAAQKAWLAVAGVTAIAVTTLPSILRIATEVGKLALAYDAARLAAAATPAAMDTAATGIGAVEGAALTATTQVSALRAGLLALSKMGLIAIGIAVTVGIAYKVGQVLAGGMKASDDEEANRTYGTTAKQDAKTVVPYLKNLRAAIASGKGGAFPTDQAGVQARQTIDRLTASDIAKNHPKSAAEANRYMLGHIDKMLATYETQSTSAPNLYDVISRQTEDVLRGTLSGITDNAITAMNTPTPHGNPNAGGGGGGGGGRNKDAERAAKERARQLREAAIERVTRQSDALKNQFDSVLSQYEQTGDPALLSRLRLIVGSLYLADKQVAEVRFEEEGGAGNPAAVERRTSAINVGADKRRQDLMRKIDAASRKVLTRANQRFQKSLSPAERGLSAGFGLMTGGFNAIQQAARAKESASIAPGSDVLGTGLDMLSPGLNKIFSPEAALQRAGGALYAAARSGSQSDLATAFGLFDQARLTGKDHISGMRDELGMIQQFAGARGSKLGSGQAAPLVLRRLNEIRSDAVAAKDAGLVLDVDDAIAKWKDAMQASSRLFADSLANNLGNAISNAFTDIFSGRSDFAQNLGKNLFGGVVRDVGQEIGDRFARSARTRLEDWFTSAKGGFGSLFKGAEVSAGRIALTGFGLLSAIQAVLSGRNHGGGLFGSILGGLGGFLAAGPAGILPGIGVGGNLFSGNYAGAIAAGLSFPGVIKGGSVSPGNLSYTYANGSVVANGRSVGGGHTFILNKIHQGDVYDHIDRQRDEAAFVDDVRALISRV